MVLKKLQVSAAAIIASGLISGAANAAIWTGESVAYEYIFSGGDAVVSLHYRTIANGGSDYLTYNAIGAAACGMWAEGGPPGPWWPMWGTLNCDSNITDIQAVVDDGFVYSDDYADLYVPAGYQLCISSIGAKRQISGSIWFSVTEPTSFACAPNP